MNKFFNAGSDVWDHEEIEDIIFNALYALNAEIFTIHPLSHSYTFRDNLVCKTIGCYFPPKDRIFYGDCIDVRNDGIPGVCCLSGFGGNYDLSKLDRVGEPPTLTNLVLFPIKKLPKTVKGVPCDQYYKILHWEFFEDGIPDQTYDWAKFNKNVVKDSSVVTFGTYVGIKKDGDRIIPVFDSKNVDGGRYTNRAWVKDIFAICSSAYLDSKFMWNVDCYYQYSKAINVWIRFGVYEEHIKSLLYARDLPITETGRKRPIQHWVKSHKRRIKKGTDITTVKKHLRGINKFEMFGYKFLISNPIKNDGIPELFEREFWINEAINAPPVATIKQLHSL